MRKLGAAGGDDARAPEDLRRDRRVGAPPRDRPRKEPRLRSHPAVVRAQRRQQGRAERDVAIPPALAPLNVNQHAPTVDVRNLQMPQLRIPHAGRVQDHQHRAMRQVLRRVDQVRDVIDAQNLRESTRGLGYGVSSNEYRRFNVFTKKKRIAQTWSRTVRGASFRSRRRWA